MTSTDTKAEVKAEVKDEKNAVTSLDEGESKPLKLSSKDKKDFNIERKFAFISTLVKTSLETDDTSQEVPIPGVQGNVLQLVVEYMAHHKGTEPPLVDKPLRSKQMKDVVSDKWDAEYIDRIGENRQQLYDLILAANYMDVKSLLHLGCAKVASLIKGQPLEKIKEILDPKGGGDKKEDKKEEKKEDIEPNEEVLNNPSRIIPRQYKHVTSMTINNDFTPIVPKRHTGFILLKKTNNTSETIYFEDEIKRNQIAGGAKPAEAATKIAADVEMPDDIDIEVVKKTN